MPDLQKPPNISCSLITLRTLTLSPLRQMLYNALIFLSTARQTETDRQTHMYRHIQTYTYIYGCWWRLLNQARLASDLLGIIKLPFLLWSFDPILFTATQNQNGQHLEGEGVAQTQEDLWPWWEIQSCCGGM
jgi:hypothetical protein